MTITVVDRTTLQTAFAALITSSLVGTSLQAVYAYQVAELTRKQAVAIVTSAGSQRRNPFLSTRSKSLVFLDVHVLVLYADTANSWTEAQSEARLNTIEKGISEIVDNNRETANWMDLDFAGKTEISPVTIGGVDFRYEVIPLVFEVHS